MKLLSCHIDGFGNIRDMDITFEEGVNVICEKNGFGKTTLASFLKVMFYGFEDENKKCIKDKEREKYRPWDKGLYGGSLVFECNGKKYRAFRTFGKNEGNDSFELRNYETNAVSEDFSKTDMGSRIFGIDRASFFRTAYFASKDLVSKDDAVTDSIRAKLGNLTDATDDINNYEKVTDRLNGLKNEYSPDRKKGKIYALREELYELENALKSTDDTDKAIESLEKSINEEYERIALDKEKIGSLKEEIKKAHDAENAGAKLETYQNLKAEFDESARKAREAGEVFKGRIPGLSEIDNVEELAGRNSLLIKSMNDNRFYMDNEWKKLNAKFKNGCPNQTETDYYSNLWNEREKSVERAENLLKRKEELKKEYETKQAAYEKDAEEKRKFADEINEKRKKQKMFFIAAGILIAAAALVFLFVPVIPQMIVRAVSGAVGLLAALILFLMIPIMKLNKKESPDFGEEPGDVMSDAEYADLDKREAQEIGRAEKNEKTVREFLLKYEIPFDEKNVKVDLYKLSDESQRYSVGIEKLKVYEEARKEYEDNERTIDKFFEETGTKEGIDAAASVRTLRDALIKKSEAESETERKRLKLSEFEADNNIGELRKLCNETTRSTEAAAEDIKDIEEDIEDRREYIRRFRERLDSEQEKKDELREKEAEAEKVREKLGKFENFYRILEKTGNYLKDAKDGLSQKFTGPAMNAFKKYCGYFEEQNDEDFGMDTDFRLTKVEAGMPRETGEFSFGQKDVMNLCLRLAFIDAMYENEKPFLIMDDPFVNLDEKNLGSAGHLLKKVSEEYQVIYFTCHECRGGVII